MLRQDVKRMIKRTFLYRIIRSYEQEKEYREWLRSGKPNPPPFIAKRMILRQYAKDYGVHVFVETGTFFGDTVDAVKDIFNQIYSVELSDELYESDKIRFRGQKHISIVKGNSQTVLPQILRHITEPCLFWLDAHYSGPYHCYSEGITAKGEKETPVLDELGYILSHTIKGHIILIDDARLFTGENDWPSIPELREFVLSRSPDNLFEVECDIIRIHNNRGCTTSQRLILGSVVK